MKAEAITALESLRKGAEVFVKYILPSAIMAVAASPELRDFFSENPSLAAYAPIINVALISIVEQWKAHFN
jgi:hypothetical protein